MGNDISQPNELNFDYISNEVAVPSWSTREASESKRTELLMRRSYFRPLTSLGGKKVMLLLNV